MDGSVIEVFLDSKEAITVRNYTLSRGDIQMVWTGAPEALKDLKISEIRPISDDRLTS
jgi:hypothetical protein